jgi:hypothetical protein
MQRLALLIEEAESLGDSWPIQAGPPQHRLPRIQHNHTRDRVTTEIYTNGAEGVTVTNRTSRKNRGYGAGTSKPTEHCERSIPYRNSSSGHQQQAPSQPRPTPAHYTQSFGPSNGSMQQDGRSATRSSGTGTNTQDLPIPHNEAAPPKHARSKQHSKLSRPGHHTAGSQPQTPHRREGLASLFKNSRSEKEDWEIYDRTSASEFHRDSDASAPVQSEKTPVPSQTQHTTETIDTTEGAETAKAKKPAKKTNGIRKKSDPPLGASTGRDPRDKHM